MQQCLINEKTKKSVIAIQAIQSDLCGPVILGTDAHTNDISTFLHSNLIQACSEKKQMKGGKANVSFSYRGTPFKNMY